VTISEPVNFDLLFLKQLRVAITGLFDANNTVSPMLFDDSVPRLYFISIISQYRVLHL